MKKASKDESSHDHPNFDGFDMNKIQRNFKALADELQQGGISINNLLNDKNQNSKEVKVPYFRGYTPGVQDYLQRATTVRECQEIISFCLNQGEIDETQASELLRRLTLGGPRAFGTRKPGYYDSKL